MATKKTAKKAQKKAPAGLAADPSTMPARVPPADADPEGDVMLVRLPNGAAAFQPRWVRDLPPEAREMCTELQEQVAIVNDLLDTIDQTSRDLREVVGLSWQRIGWLLGLSGEAVRKRVTAE